MTTTEIYPHITRNQRGEPTIIGTRTRVQSIVCYYKLGMSAEEIHAALPYLSDAELHAAFAYYFDNREEIERLIEEEDEFYQQAKAQYGTVEDLIREKNEAKQREMAVKI
ncbi:MAG: DUF433 domain-containing protein [Candidatus Kapaibacterium sp.]|nr:MAG: DUF433 domain-containing protein [Candidatus Kapabacteria bacterium]